MKIATSENDANPEIITQFFYLICSIIYFNCSYNKFYLIS